MKSLFLPLFTVLLLSSSYSQLDTVELVKNFNTSQDANSSSSPLEFILISGVKFFTASDGNNGRELWKTDGTESGTVLIKDINPGSNSSQIDELTNLNGTLYFRADNGTNGRELWKSDGTNAGTVLVKDINPGTGDGFPSKLTVSNGTLFFIASDGVNGFELWKSDGTSAGTVMVKDIRPGASNTSLSVLTNVNGTLYFSANDGVNGVELWKSDGTTAGTVIVKDINPGSGNSNPQLLTNVNGVLYFRASDATNGLELWKSDGTSGGTVLVKDIRPGTSTSSPTYITNVNGVVYFRGNDGTTGNELWKSDGTSAGTVLVKDIGPGTSGSSPTNLINVNGTLYFRAYDPTYGFELWKSDGTSAGTIMVKDINPGTSSSNITELTNFNGTLYFRASNATTGFEFWKSDGTTAGTILVKDINPGVNSGSPQRITVLNGTLYFGANNGLNGYELWKSDGTSAGTIMVKDIYQKLTSGNILNITKINETLYFSANDGVTGLELWKSDGTTAGTVLVKDIISGNDGSNPSKFTDVNGVLFFTAYEPINGVELWKSDGTTAGTVLVRDIRPGNGGSNPANLTNVNGVLFFTAFDATNGVELWKSDGTTAGTVLVRDIRSGNSNSSPSELTNVNGVLYFRASDVANASELWKSDGTFGGTVLVKDIYSGVGNGSPSRLTNVNGTLYFRANDGTTGNELWKTDGTSGGTVLVKDIYSGVSSGNPFELTNVNGVLYFSANDATNGTELWKSDGTTAGTVLVKDIISGINSSSPNRLANVNGVLYFMAYEPISGTELWKSDGTSGGTVLVKDIEPGTNSGNPYNLTDGYGTLYFTATNSINGNELWKSDGTSAGTEMIQDLYPTRGNSNTNFLTPFDSTIYFSGDNGYITGALWKLAEAVANTYDTITVSACNGYTGKAGTLWTIGGTYYDTIPNNLGAESITTYYLTINESSSFLDILITCDSFTWINGITYSSNNTTAKDTLLNAAGCDSIVSLFLIVRNTTLFTDTQVHCESYTWRNGITYTASNSIAKDTIFNSQGCDSIISLDLTINSPSAFTDVISACASYTWIDGITYTSNNNVATHTLTNSVGCDSVVSLNLTLGNQGAKIVMNTNDAGPGSLRQTIADACPGDTIRFDEALIATGSDSIVLTSEIAFDKNLTIIGLYTATDSLFISGNNTNRIFNVDLSTSIVRSLVLDSMNMINGNSGANEGGALLVRDATELIINQSFISENEAEKGGGIAIISEDTTLSFTLSNSTISKNSAGSFDEGGGIYIKGAIFSTDSVNVLFENTTIDRNDGDYGGGAIVRGHNILFNSESCTFSNQTTGYEAGAICFLGRTSTIVNFNNSTIVNNTVIDDCGGILVNANSGSLMELNITNSTIVNNVDQYVGAIRSYGSVNSVINLGSSIVAFNTISNISHGNPQTINSLGYNIFNDASITGSVATDQLGVTLAQLDLGILQNNGGTTETMLPGCSSVAYNMGNPSDISGAQNNVSLNGIRDVGSAEKSAINIVQNTNNSGPGSLRQTIIDACPGDTIRFNPNLIASGNATILLASELYFTKHLSFVGLISTTDTLFISGNNNSRVFFADLGSSTVKNISMDSMVVVNGSSNFGGAIRVTNGDSLTIFNSIISNSNGTGGGGGIAMNSSDSIYIYIENSSLFGNTSGGRGGAVHSQSSIYSEVVVDNSSIYDNSTPVYGAGIYSGSSLTSSTSKVILNNSTIVNNTGTIRGGGVFVTASNQNCIAVIEATNSTITGNSGTTAGGGLYTEAYGSASIQIMKLESSIVAFNGNNNIYNNGNVPITSLGYNIFDNTSLNGSVLTDQLGIDSAQLNLGLLQFNGGTTKTILPGLGSVALNNGNPSDFSDAQNWSILLGRRDVGSAEGIVSCYTNGGAIISGCDSVNYNGVNYSSSQIIIDTLAGQASNLCDSIVEIQIVINSPTSSTDVQSHCDSYTWIDGITYTTSNNSATHTINNSVGCDSVITLDLTINKTTTSVDVQSHCDSFTWRNGVTYTSTINTVKDTLVGGNSVGCDSIISLNLVIRNSSSSTETITACDSFTWRNGVTYIANNTTAKDTTINSMGCDSIITLNLIINNSTSSIDTILACDSYVWIDGITYTSNNSTASKIYTNSAGCDSIVTLNLTINSATSSTVTITACDNFTWIDGITYTSSNNSATHTINNSVGCDSVVTLDLTINKSSSSVDVQSHCDSYTWRNGVTYTNSINSVKDTLVGGNSVGCDSIVSLFLTIKNKTFGTETISACDSFTWRNGVTYTTNNTTAKDTTFNSMGCDSIIILNLTINNSSSSTDTITACDNYVWIDGITYTANNTTATKTYTNSSGCDSIVTLNLTINNATISTDSQTACDSYTWIDGMTYTSSNNSATHTLTNSKGCDSIVMLDLTINNSTSSVDVQNHCGSYTWINGVTYTTSNNTVKDTTINGAGCDSIISLNLVIRNSSFYTETITTCDSFTWRNGVTYTSNNSTAKDTTFNSMGCDSIITLNLTINNSTSSTDTITACDSYIWIDGITYSANNTTATKTYTNTSGCDSIVTLYLKINNSTTSVDFQNHCGSYTWIDGMTYTSSNSSATHTLINSKGCDSIVMLDLTINNSTSSVDVQNHCGSYTWINGVTYTTSNTTAKDTLTNSAGCDSIISLNLVIRNSSNSTETITACDSFTWRNGVTYTSSNATAKDTTFNSMGCDSIITLNLTINNSSSSTDTITACDSYVWIDGITYTTNNTTATKAYTNAAGCDSIVTLNLTINNSTSSTDTQIACNSYTWIDGNIYTASNNSATHTLINSKGCDSIVMLDLTINNTTSSVDVQNHCESYTWINGVTYTASNNTAKDTTINGAGCDSIISLNLIVRNSSTSTETITACDSYTWRNGVTYTASNTTAKDTTFNSMGCDSIITLNLTINNSTSSTDMQVHCDSYTWIDGVTYTASNNTSTKLLVNSKGCDSVVTLNLIINSSTNSIDVQSHCDSYTWIDGNTYTASNNSSTQILTNSTGCDSIVTLNLTIKKASTSVDVQNHCDSYTWINGITYTSTNMSVKDTLVNAAGCDSIISLNLVIGSRSFATETITACDSYTWINGVTYTVSNSTAKDTIFNSTGCDSIISLNLTIINSTSSTDVQTACDSYTWIDGNTYTSSNNFATHTLTNLAGCDSIVTLNLIINRTSSSTNVQTACGSYTWINGVTYTANNNTAKDTLTNAAGCDSIVSLYLTINTVNTAVTRIGATLTATTTGANYQWIDCDNGDTAITGATNQNFIATTNGNYAVIIIKNGCTDTSACTSINSVGVESHSNSIEWNLFPNPASDKVTLTFSEAYENGSVKIFNPFGKLVYEGRMNKSQTNLTIDVSQLSNGMYTVVVVSGTKSANKKIVISR